LGDNIVAVDGIFAVNPDGTQKWLFDQTCQGIIAGPNVGPDGKIYAVSDAGGIGAFALNPDGALAYAVERFGEHGSLGEEIVFGPPAPGLPPTQQYFQFDNGNLFGYTLQGQRVFSYPTVTTGQPVAGLRTGSVYTVGFPIGAGYRLLSLTPQGALRWQAPIRPTSGLSAPDTPLNEAAVYVVQDAFKLHRVSPSDGSVVWTFTDGEELFAPVASPDDRLVLLGGRVNYGQPGFFEAVSNDGRLLWKQYLPNEPGFSPDGVVMPISRARFAADGQTAYIAADVIGDKPSASNPVYSFFYALDTSNNSVPANQPPRATLTSPSPNANVPVRTGINLTAKVEDDGQIARVDFYYNRNGFQTLFGSDTTPDADGNYGFNFTPTEPGVYGLFAAAYDVGGLRGDSPLVTITVSSHPPTVAWASPAAGSSFAAPASLTLTARAADSDGTVVGVEFKSAQVGVLGSDMTPDAAGLYQIEWANPPQGAHELTASAIDDSGHIRSASITVNVAPASIPTYALGGTVRDSGGAPLSGVNVTLDNSTPATTTTGADGSYFFSGLRGGGNYSVTPSKSGYSFSPAQRVYNDLSANQTADFAATPLTYTLSGRVAHGEIGLAGATITISGDRAGATTTDAQGNYSFGSLPSGGSVLVTPSLANYTFTPPSRSINLDGERSGIDFAAVPVPPMVRFSASAYQFSEAGGRAEITLTRSGDISGAASILFQTLDDAEAVPCATLNGKAYARCDYATTIETLSWPAGDAQPKIVSIPLIDDSRAEAAETLRIKLSGLQGVAIGDPGTALLTITDNDGEGAANPIFDTSFFVRMQYLDFLSREPEPGEPWSEVLNRCPNVNSDLTCDRILVSQSFFGSPEFRLKGFYAFKFYRVAFDRIPAYEEIIPDMRSVSGATAAEVYGKRAAHPVNFTNRSEFKELYDALDNAAFVNALLGRYQLQRITTTDPANPEGETKVVLTREDLINRLAASGALSLTRAQTLRALVESDEVGAAEYNRAFVAMQYYGYLRRTPEADGYQSWLKVINQDPNNVRLMVNGFMNSDEYRLRFGNPNQ
ncbi:MAG TPA: carboxypeptidase regulatory-like domain-containing protein, partial [Pyrinomonadaceae bacterium]|nr:carboxypeptidase regulatory-like domain-containing protein [Pyrinomonadaceae bacterium]